jgi:hypothetical protein
MRQRSEQSDELFWGQLFEACACCIPTLTFKVSDSAAINFADKLTKHTRVSRGWSAFSISVQSIQIGELPPLGTPQQTRGNLTAWIVD